VGTTLEPATLALESRRAEFSIDVLDVNADDREITVGLSVENADSTHAVRPRPRASPELLRLPDDRQHPARRGDRCAIVSTGSRASRGRHAALFPGAYASLKEKPYYSEVIESIRRANEGVRLDR